MLISSIVPAVVAAYYVRKWYLSYRLKVHGIGKGGMSSDSLVFSPYYLLTKNIITAPGFQTNVRQLRVTPDIAARLRRGEDVTPEEMAAAARAADATEQPRGIVEERDDRPKDQGKGKGKLENEESVEPVNEWLEDTAVARGRGTKKRKSKK
jgi:hypothetical protein